ncbi:NADPH:quinone reductase-like Zn-dependent oxidoreductase [Volucribacter psittacicida]|uniref:NADPH:quinone reductase-like Zn-dependent oxidoreductase n=1 Tax=Volucribacter psittacicida TaxID=203482 RepID=A0A4R1FN62_9PAST|nr:zinc-binding dehydrogenase [Volucribacter psittacicida]TCJ94834.1 NADPH:quinone reductase-like Zn-dependent oxidoreductase [Volucribacter psittacicida]
MKAAIFQQFGEPEQVMQFSEQQDMPKAKAGEVLVKMRLSPIHNHDLWTIRGTYGYKPELPAVAGSEAVGVIEALGEGVSHLQVGQRISVASAKGAWAEYFTIPANQAVPVPDELSDEMAAQLIAMPFSCLTLLEFIGAKAGDWLALNAASGAVGKMTALLAKARGINVINLVRRQSAIAELNALGIDHVVSTDSADWQQQVRAIVGEQGIMAAVDSIGGKASLELSQLLAQGGSLISFGTMGGEPMQIPTGDLIFKQIHVKGFWGALVSQQMPAEQRKQLMQELIGYAIGGKIPMPVEGIYPLSEIKQACQASLAQGKKGKVLLRG